MACPLLGVKPLSYCQLDHEEHISMKYYLKFKRFHSRKCIWKYHLRKDGHFVSASMRSLNTPAAGTCLQHKITNIQRVHFQIILQWRHNKRDGVSNHQLHDCLINSLFRRRSNKISKLCVTGLGAGNSPVTVEFPAQRASDAQNVSIWLRHHEVDSSHTKFIWGNTKTCLHFLPFHENMVVRVVYIRPHIMLEARSFDVVNITAADGLSAWWRRRQGHHQKW